MTHVEKAKELRTRTDVRFNCCQSILVAFAEEIGLTEEQAYNLGINFNAGMRCGSVCGALTGALMVLGMAHCPPEQADALREKFSEDCGEVNCAALLQDAQDRGVAKNDCCLGLVIYAAEALEQMVGKR